MLHVLQLGKDWSKTAHAVTGVVRSGDRKVQCCKGHSHHGEGRSCTMVVFDPPGIFALYPSLP